MVWLLQQYLISNDDSTPLGPYPCPGCPSESQVTPLVQNLGQFAINHQLFPLLTPCKEGMVGEVANVSTQVVAGTNFFLTMKVTVLSGKNCKDVSRFICSNVVIFKHLPVNCGGSIDTCTQLIRPQEIRCSAGSNYYILSSINTTIIFSTSPSLLCVSSCLLSCLC